MKIRFISSIRATITPRIIIVFVAATVWNSCSFQEQHNPYTTVAQRQADFSPLKNFQDLPTRQRQALKELFVEEFYHIPSIPSSNGADLNTLNISAWRKAKKRKILPINTSKDSSLYFRNYSYGMWVDIYETLKNNPTYLEGRGLIALCHYLTYLQYGDVCRPEESFFTKERLQALPIEYHRKKHHQHGVYSAKEKTLTPRKRLGGFSLSS